MNTDTLTMSACEKLAAYNKFVRMAIGTINDHAEDEARPIRNWKVQLALGVKEDIKLLRNEVFRRGTVENADADEMLRAVRKIREMVGTGEFEFVDPIEIYRA